MNPKLRDDLNLILSEKFESVWVESKPNFDGVSKERMLINLCYNPNRTNFTEFLEQLTLNIDNTLSISNQIFLIGDNNLKYLNKSRKENLVSIIIPYRMKVFCPKDATRVSAKTPY